VYDTAKPRTLIIDHGGQVRNIDILGSSGQYGIAIIILFPFFRRSSLLQGQEREVWLCTRKKGWRSPAGPVRCNAGLASVVAKGSLFR